MKQKIAALIVAAGRGLRANSGATNNTALPKQFAPLAGEMVLTQSVRTFLAHNEVSLVQVVISNEGREGYAAAVAPIESQMSANLSAPVVGGADRQASVLAGLNALAHSEPDLVLIHDGARPFVSDNLISAVIAAIPPGGGAIPGLPIADTVKRTNGEMVGDTVDRAGLFTVQTPQGFDFKSILSAHQAAALNDTRGLTDDAAVAHSANMAMHFVHGDADNVKLTFPGDLERAEAYLTGRPMTENSRDQSQNEAATSAIDTSHAGSETAGGGSGMRRRPRVGMGFDVHSFEPGDHVMLCGVALPHDKKLKGHSDADVALHALTDALYGALGEGDIGSHFPPSDPQWRGTASSVFLEHAVQRVKARGGQIINVDLTIICEMPKITPHRERLTTNLAAILMLDASDVSVKATTTEKLGFTGRGEGIAAQAVVMIEI